MIPQYLSPFYYSETVKRKSFWSNAFTPGPESWQVKYIALHSC